MEDSTPQRRLAAKASPLNFPPHSTIAAKGGVGSLPFVFIGPALTPKSSGYYPVARRSNLFHAHRVHVQGLLVSVTTTSHENNANTRQTST